MLKNYSDLPDYMSPEDLQTIFNNLLTDVENSDIDLDSAMQGLWELADRQWHTYSILEIGTKTRVERFVCNILLNRIWENKPIIFLRYVLSVIGNLGLGESYKLVKETLSRQDVSPNPMSEILKFVDQIDRLNKGKVDNPYITP